MAYNFFAATGVLVWLVVAGILLCVLAYFIAAAVFAVSVHYWQIRCAIRHCNFSTLQWRKCPKSLFAQFVQFSNLGLSGWSITEHESGATWNAPWKYTLPPPAYKDTTK